MSHRPEGGLLQEAALTSVVPTPVGDPSKSGSVSVGAHPCGRCAARPAPGL